MFAAAAEGDFSDNLRVNISWISVDNANVVYNSSGKPVGVQAPIVVTFPVITYPGITPAQALANATNAANKAVLYLKAIFAGGASRALLPRTYAYIAYITQTPPGLIPAPGVNTNPSVTPPSTPSSSSGIAGSSSISPGAAAAIAIIVIAAIIGAALYVLWPKIVAFRMGRGKLVRGAGTKAYEHVGVNNPVASVMSMGRGGSRVEMSPTPLTSGSQV